MVYNVTDIMWLRCLVYVSLFPMRNVVHVYAGISRMCVCIAKYDFFSVFSLRRAFHLCCLDI
jgi:hypothetical protein